MPPKLDIENVKAFLNENECKLLSEYKNSKTKITIICKCGHKRTTLYFNIKMYKQFLCKECTIGTNLYQVFAPKAFSKMQRLLETKIKISLKYKNDFQQENINKKLLCLDCNIKKPKYLFFNNNLNKSGKKSYCKICQNEQDKIRKQNHTNVNRIKTLLSSVQASLRKGRVDEINIDLDYLLKLNASQENKCVYSGNQLSWKANDINTCSLDRIDSSKGYIKGNVQFVSKTVNQAKSDLTEQEFLKLVQQIYRFQYFNYIEKEIDNKLAIKHIRKLFKTCKSSIKKRQKKERPIECFEFDLTIDFILNLARKQGNRCAYSGKELIWTIKNNYSTSIDRIDSDKGYTKDNVHLVSKIANQAKNNLTHDEFLEMINTIYNHSVESHKKFRIRNNIEI